MSTLIFHTVRVARAINYPLILLLLSGVLGGAAAFPASYLAGLNALIGLCLFPFAIFVEGKTRVNPVYVAILIVFSVLAFQYDIKVFYFIALSFYFILVIEFFLGKINALILFLVIVMSPAFLQVSVIFGFPIRLLLSNWASGALEIFGLDVHAEGNMIMLNGSGFAVDEACMGLNMLAVSMLMGVFVLIHHYKTTRHTFTLFQLIVFFVAVFGLNIVANLFRIITLVLFRILPTDPLHGPVGILCLVCYTMVPLYFLGGWMIKRMGKPKLPHPVSIRTVSKPVLAILAVASLLVVSVGFTIDPVRVESEIPYAQVSMKGMKTEQLNGGITKLIDDTRLIYVKPIPEFFTGEHTPLLCWKGSGYEFKQVKEQSVAGIKIFTGTLVKESAVLYTAWWYTNGQVETIDQLTWRTLMVKGGKSFCLVNVTAKDEATMLETVETMLTEKNLLIN